MFNTEDETRYRAQLANVWASGAATAWDWQCYWGTPESVERAHTLMIDANHVATAAYYDWCPGEREFLWDAPPNPWGELADRQRAQRTEH